MTEIKDPILAAMEFSLNYTLKRFEDTETEDGKIIREGIIRGKTLVEHLRIFGADVYGKSKEQFAEDIKDKTPTPPRGGGRIPGANSTPTVRRSL